MSFASVCSSLRTQWILKENISSIVILGLRCWLAYRPIGLLHTDGMGYCRCRDMWYKESVIYALGMMDRLDARVPDLSGLECFQAIKLSAESGFSHRTGPLAQAFVDVLHLCSSS